MVKNRIKKKFFFIKNNDDLITELKKKGINNCRVYHFGSITTRKKAGLTKNKGNRLFLQKWGISSDLFLKFYLRSNTQEKMFWKKTIQDLHQDKNDFKKAIEIIQKYNVLLAGGLNTENIQRITEDLYPWGVDVSSGVESNEIKDKNKIESFILSVQGVKY